MNTTTKTINAVRVMAILADCLFQSGEVTDDMVKVEGIVTTYGFHPEKLESHREEVKAMLDFLPPQFREDKTILHAGGGWSFLNACNDKHDVQWTGEHRVMEALFALGIGLGYARWLLPRVMWSAFPGGMPYVAVNLSEKEG